MVNLHSTLGVATKQGKTSGYQKHIIMKPLLFNFLLFITMMSGITVLNAQQSIKPGARSATQNQITSDNKTLNTGSEITNVGAATIYKSYPDWLPIKVNPNFNKSTGPAHRVPGQAIPLNNWFSPLFWWKDDLDYDPFPQITNPKATNILGAGDPFWPMPLSNQASPWGLMITYQQEYQINCTENSTPPPCEWPNSPDPMGCAAVKQFGFFRSPNDSYNCWTISVENLLVDKSKNPFFVKPVAFGDWDAHMKWDDGQRSLTITSLAGSPMLYGEASGGELEIQLPAGDEGTGDGPLGVTFYNSRGDSIGRSSDTYPAKNPYSPDFSKVEDGIVGLRFIAKKAPHSNKSDTIYYACFAPQKTKWQFTQGFRNPSQGGGEGRGGYLTKLKSTNLKSETFHFTVALLPALADKTKFPLEALKAFKDAAGYHVSKTTFTWDTWDAAKSSITAHYTFNVKNVTSEIPSANPSVITALFKPHQKLMGNAAPYLLAGSQPCQFVSPRGPLKVVQLPLNQTKTSAQFDVAYPYYGYVPVLPDPELQGDELSNLLNYISADSRQTSAASADFFTESISDAYTMGTNLYYKAMQLAFGLQQFQGIKNIPNWRGKGATVDKDTAIQDITGFMKADIEDFFTAQRDSNLAFQWKYIHASGDDVYGFKKLDHLNIPPPAVFPCDPPNSTSCNPNDPLNQVQTGPYWELAQADLIQAQKDKKNPYIVLRNIDFTVNKYLKTAPSINQLLHLAWQQHLPTTTNTPYTNVDVYVFFAPSSKKANPNNIKEWTQCVSAKGDTTKTGLYIKNNVGIGGGPGIPGDTSHVQWRITSFNYNGLPEFHPNLISSGMNDILFVFDCGADCNNFPQTCNGQNGPSWANADGWKLVFSPCHFNGKERRFISYDSTWNTMLGNIPWYGSIENMADHHFGWGYIIKAAAFVAQFGNDPTWANQEKWGGLVNLLIRDVMDWRKPETEAGKFNFVRNKYLNPVEGHMYADGCGSGGIGNNEESSSEAVNFADACIEWGTATGQDDIRDLGILLRSMYNQAVPMYWFNVDGDVLPSTSADKAFPIAGQIWGAANQHDTFFSGGDVDHGCPSRNSDIVAIQTLPLTASTLRLSTLKYNPDLNTNRKPLEEAWKTVTLAGGPYCNDGKCYLSTLFGFQSLFDSKTALSNFKKKTLAQGASLDKWYNYNPKNGGLSTPNDHSYAATYFFMNSLKKSGIAAEKQISSSENNPFYMPLADGSFLVYNYTKKDQRFTIGGKQTPLIPALRCIRVP